MSKKIDLLFFTVWIIFGIQDSIYVGACDSETEFECVSNGKCIPKLWTCDLDKDCLDGSDEHSDYVDCEPRTCSPDQFTCRDKPSDCLPSAWVCDQEQDCEDGSDEDPILCANKTCTDAQFTCTSSQACIPLSWRCDEQQDCSDNSDENNCDHARRTCQADEHRCHNGRCISEIWKCDGDNDCSDGVGSNGSDEEGCPATTCSPDQFRCVQTGRCIPARWKCDGIPDCHQEDESDEAGCPPRRNDTCRHNEFMCNDGKCIHKEWKCDGHPDCMDDSDEDVKLCGVTTPSTCSPTEFRCHNGQCIPGTQECDGQHQCSDQSDEMGVDCYVPCDTLSEFDCTGGDPDHIECIPLRQLCDGVVQCTNEEDEASAMCAIDPCEDEPCPAGLVCVRAQPDTHNYTCECPQGYKFNELQECVDIDECKEVPGACSHLCENREGHYKCRCHPGYELDPVQTGFCRALGSRPQLLFSNREDLRSFEISTSHYKELIEHTQSAIAIDYDFTHNYIFWSDVAMQKIFMATISGHLRALPAELATVLVNGSISTPDGLAYDWIHQNLYWTDTGHNTISVINIHSKQRVNIIANNVLDEPRAIVVDPREEHGMMYWTDWGNNPHIARAGMDGSSHMTIVSSDHVMWPNGLTIDYTRDRLYWVDAKLNKIGSSNLYGRDIATVLQSDQYLKHPFAISLFEDTIYWTDWGQEAILGTNKFRSRGVDTILTRVQSPMDLQVYHAARQPKHTNYCSNAQCSHLCLRAPHSSRNSAKITCKCPVGWVMRPGNTTHCMEIVDGSRIDVSRPMGRGFMAGKKGEQWTSGLQGDDEGATGGSGSSMAGVGTLAAIISSILLVLVIIGALIGYIAYRHYMKKNVKSMNFENPVYRKTTEEQFSLETNEYQPNNKIVGVHPTMEPLTEPDRDLV